jgi:hypothetical protein
VSDTNPREDLDAEGIPDIEDHPPGIDVETDGEGMIAPRDHAIAAGDDPAYPVTAAEQRVPEGLTDRADREIPDVGVEELNVGGSAPDTGGADDDYDGADSGETIIGLTSAGPAADPSTAVASIEEPLLEPADEATATAAPVGAQLVGPDSDDGTDVEPAMIAASPEDSEVALSPEEAAMEVSDDDAV